MTRIVTLYSYRGGAGKSTTAVSLARMLAQRGQRVAVVDTDLQSPTVHTLFNLTGIPEWISFTDYLIGRCSLREAVQPIPSRPQDGPGGRLFAVPACNRSYKMEAILERGYDIGLLHEAFDELSEALRLDALVLDTHSGTTNETAVALSRSDAVVMMARADRIDLVNAPKAAQLVSTLTDAPRLLAVGMAPACDLDADTRAHLEEGYGTAVVAQLPISSQLAEDPCGTLAGLYPEHPLSAPYRRLADAFEALEYSEDGAR